MTTDDELRKLIALSEKATARPWNCDTQLGNVEPYTDEHEIGVYDGVDHEDYGYDANGIKHQASIGFCYSDSDGKDALNNAAYITAAANLAPEIAAELIAAREALVAVREWLWSGELAPGQKRGQPIVAPDDVAKIMNAALDAIPENGSDL